MPKLFALLALLAPAVSAFAAPEQRFTPWERLGPAAQKELLSVKRAVHRLETDAGSCGATTISNNGTLLTARHCLQVCLMREKIFRLVFRPGGVSYFELDRKAQAEKTCAATLDGKPVLLELLATSPGLVVSMDEAGFRASEPEWFSEMEAQGYTDAGDFALVRVKGMGQSEPCLPLSDGGPALAAEVFNLGYPGKTRRGDGFNSDGEQLYFTKGEVTNGSADIACLAEDNLTEFQLSDLRRRFDRPKFFTSSLDAVYGSSGSSVVDGHRRVLGIIAYVYAPYKRTPENAPEARYCRGGTKVLRASAIRQAAGDFQLAPADLSCLAQEGEGQ